MDGGDKLLDESAMHFSKAVSHTAPLWFSKCVSQGCLHLQPSFVFVKSSLLKTSLFLFFFLVRIPVKCHHGVHAHIIPLPPCSHGNRAVKEHAEEYERRLRTHGHMVHVELSGGGSHSLIHPTRRATRRDEMERKVRQDAEELEEKSAVKQRWSHNNWDSRVTVTKYFPSLTVF